jgi:DNA-binding XRE family transcriptional regulator
MQTQTINLGGETYVVLPKADYDRLATLAKASDLPQLPAPNAQGNVPAVAYARASIAREIIIRRGAAGWTQKQLADAAGVRVETVCRIETGKHTASVATIEQLDRALKSAERPRDPRRRR